MFLETCHLFFYRFIYTYYVPTAYVSRSVHGFATIFVARVSISRCSCFSFLLLDWLMLWFDFIYWGEVSSFEGNITKQDVYGDYGSSLLENLIFFFGTSDVLLFWLHIVWEYVLHVTFLIWYIVEKDCRKLKFCFQLPRKPAKNKVNLCEM